MITNCEECGKRFMTEPETHSYDGHYFCSLSCVLEWRKRPDYTVVDVGDGGIEPPTILDDLFDGDLEC
jgi:hypothetical protein